MTNETTNPNAARLAYYDAFIAETEADIAKLERQIAEGEGYRKTTRDLRTARVVLAQAVAARNEITAK